MVEPHGLGIEVARARGQNFVEVGPVQLNVWRAMQPFVLLRQGKSLDHFAGVVEPENISARTDADPRDRIAETEISQHVHGVGADLDTRPHLGELRRLFVDLDTMTRLHQATRRRESTDAGAGNQNLTFLHSVFSI